MKKSMLLGTVCLMFLANTMLAQQTQGGIKEVENKEKLVIHQTQFVNSGDNQLHISLFNSKTRIIGHESDEIIIEGKGHRPPPERAKGLKPLSNLADDNTGIGLSVRTEGKLVRIEKVSGESGIYTIKVPNKVSLFFEETNLNGGDLDILEFKGKIELKLNDAKATLTNITGPVVANSTTSDIVLKFTSLSQSSPSSITTLSGTADLHLPAKTKANLKMRSISGEIYSDFDIELTKQSKSSFRDVSGSKTLEGKTNGGGVDITLYTVTGEIFIRKSN